MDGTSTSAVLNVTISGGGQAARGNETALNLALLNAVSETRIPPQSNSGSPSTPTVSQTPTWTTTDEALYGAPIGAAVSSIVRAAEAAKVDAFWRLFGADGRQGIPLWSLASGESDSTGL
jgi:hypothetical protein